MGAPDREDRVGRAFVALADTLVADYDVIDLVGDLAGYCVSLLKVNGAAILLGDARRDLRVAAASGEDAATMQRVQLQGDQGPCLDCFTSVEPVSVPDLTDSGQAGGRWPRFLDRVSQLGAFRSVHAVPLRLRGEAIGAMGLFRREPGPLPEADLSLGQALADVATVGIVSARTRQRAESLNEQLRAALHSRVVIEQVKGILAQELGVTPDEAFEQLRRHCHEHDLRLGALAQRIAEGGVDLREVTAAMPL